MREWQVSIFAKIMANIAIMEGMKATNAQRAALKHPLGYNNKDFTKIALILNQLAEDADPLNREKK